MNDKTNSERDEEVIQEPPKITSDWLLEDTIHFINHVDTSGFGFPVTLYVKGQIVTGFLCSGKDYFDGLDEAIQEYFTVSIGEDRFGKDGLPEKDTLSGLFTNKGKHLYKEITEKKANEDPNPPGYIHLRDAQIFSENIPFRQSSGAFWRGKLSSIDGFIFGIMSSGNPTS